MIETSAMNIESASRHVRRQAAPDLGAREFCPIVGPGGRVRQHAMKTKGRRCVELNSRRDRRMSIVRKGGGRTAHVPLGNGIGGRANGTESSGIQGGAGRAPDQAIAEVKFSKKNDRLVGPVGIPPRFDVMHSKSVCNSPQDLFDILISAPRRQRLSWVLFFAQQRKWFSEVERSSATKKSWVFDQWTGMERQPGSAGH
jgi:hypothetical protein